MTAETPIPARKDFRVICGDVMQVLAGLPDESVHCVATSPPYWGLRDYGIEPSVWGGDLMHAHEWSAVIKHRSSGGPQVPQTKWADCDAVSTAQADQTSSFCACGAWRGGLGLEPTPDLFVEHLVSVFREVRRVLHSSGTLWLNMGDSYCSDGGKDRMPTALPGSHVPAGWTNRAQPQRVHALRVNADRDPKRSPENAGAGLHRGVVADGILKPKDMVMMPARIALALQADGWYLRSMIPWLKHNAMPESVRDRPTNAVEYIFLLSKDPEPYYDQEAVRIASSGTGHDRGDGVNPKAMGPNSRTNVDRDPSHQTAARIRAKQNRSFSAAVHSITTSRVRRNTDWFFSSLEDYTREFQGMLVDGAGEPIALVVNPQPFSLEMCEQCEEIYAPAEYRKLPKVCTKCQGLIGKEPCTCPKPEIRRQCGCGSTSWLSHFATFPSRLVEPCILAGTSEFGCCQHCGAPYRRILERQKVGDWAIDQAAKKMGVNGAKFKHVDAQAAQNRVNKNVAEARAAGGTHDNPFKAPATIGWEPTCNHPLYPITPVPCVVLDPFSGSGRTGLAAVKHGRHYIGIERNRRYVKMSEWQCERLLNPVRPLAAAEPSVGTGVKAEPSWEVVGS